jgi:hypothetical protein
MLIVTLNIMEIVTFKYFQYYNQNGINILVSMKKLSANSHIINCPDIKVLECNELCHCIKRHSDTKKVNSKPKVD